MHAKTCQTTNASTLPCRGDSAAFGHARIWYTSAATAAPTIGPAQYTAWFLKCPLTTAAPNERAGFMDAPVSEHAPSVSPTASAPSAVAANPRLPHPPPVPLRRGGSPTTCTVYTSRNVSTPSRTEPPNPVIATAILVVGTSCVHAQVHRF